MNINANSLFQDTRKTDILINAVAAGGYNLIRILDRDSSYYNPNIFGSAGNSKDVSEAQLEQFNHFRAKCKEKACI